MDAIQSISGDSRQLVINGAAVGRFSKLEVMVGAAVLAKVNAYLQFGRAVIRGDNYLGCMQVDIAGPVQ